MSSQVGSGGSNVAGVQDYQLDQLLIAVHKTNDPSSARPPCRLCPSTCRRLCRYFRSCSDNTIWSYRAGSAASIPIKFPGHRAFLGCDRLAPRQRR